MAIGEDNSHLKFGKKSRGMTKSKKPAATVAIFQFAMQDMSHDARHDLYYC